MNQLEAWLEIAVTAAHRGGEVIRHYYGRLQNIQTKSHESDLVTEADLESEKVILEELNKGLPEATVISEEGHPSITSLDLVWVVDPLDGTSNYSHSLPLVAVSIALMRKGKPIVAVVYNPLINELFTAVDGGGCFLNGAPVQVSKNNPLSKSLLVTGFAYNRRESPNPNYVEFCYFSNYAQAVRRLGAAALDLAYVACGRFEGYWEHSLNIWDIAAGVLLVKEAGGRVTDYKTDTIDLVYGEILASNGKIHDEFREHLHIACAWREKHPISLPQPKGDA